MLNRALFPLLAAFLIAGCHKKQPLADTSTVPLVPETERSAHFAAVNRNLELGGTLYGYIDVDGDPLKLAAGLQSLAGNVAADQPMAAPFLKQDYAQIFTELGFNDIKAVGISSVHAATGGFRNRAFFYMPNGRHGLLQTFGGPAGPFLYPKLAPADTDFYSESELNVAAVYAAVKAVVTRVGGEVAANAFEAQLKQAGAPAGFSVMELIQGFKGRTVMILRLDPDKTVTIPAASPIVVPAFSLLIRIDGVGTEIEKALAKAPMLEPSQDGTRHIYTLKIPVPLEGVRPVLAVDGAALYVATTPDFLRECLGRQSGLDQDAAFQKALATVGREGNGLAYVSPRFFSRVRQISTLNPNALPAVKRVLDMVVAQVPQVDQPLVAERINLPDGILVRSQWNRSLKQDVAMIGVYNPVTIGVLAAMAIPAFQKVRASSQEKTIQNNLRQLAAAADQYRLEHNAEVMVRYEDLVGPGKFIPAITPVAGEDYRSIRFKTGMPLRVRTRDGHVVEYKP